MLSNKNKERIIQKQVIKSKSNRKQNASFPLPETISSLVVLVDEKVEGINQIKMAIAKELSDSSKIDVIMLGEGNDNDMISINIRNRNFWGMVSKKELVSIDHERYDVMINLISDDSLEKEYVAACVKADVKVFMSQNRGMVYDLIIKLNDKNDPVILVKELFFYLRKLN